MHEHQVIVKRMTVLPREVVKCSYCGIGVKKAGLLVRDLDENGVLVELLFFCSVGCGMAHVDEKQPDSDDDEVVVGQ